MTKKKAQGAVRYLILLLIPVWFYYGFYGVLLDNPTAAFSYAGLFALYLCSSPSRCEIAFTMSLGLLTRVLVGFYLTPTQNYPLAAYVRVAAFLGFSSVAVLTVRAVASNKRREAQVMLLRILIFVVLGVALPVIVDFAARIRPWKLDAYLQIVEQAFGFEPNLVAAGWLATVPAFRWVCEVVYYSLPFGLALVFAAHLLRPRPHVDFLLLLYMNALAGFGLYLIYPACGPRYVFPDPSVRLSAASVAPILTACQPNAMPSLHMAGALLIWWNLRGFGRVRWAALAYLVLTAIATLGFREHYTIDLVVACPYALLIQTLATESQTRGWVGSGAAGALVLWLVALRYAAPLLGDSRILIGAAVFGTIGGTALGWRRLMTGERKPYPNQALLAKGAV